MDTAAPRIVVLGAGFAGLTFCQSFRHPAARVTLLDRQNHHLFQPLLYQVATAGLSAPEIAQPIRSILADHPNVAVRLAEVRQLDLAGRRVLTDTGEVPYDYLVVALGGRTSYFGHPEWEQFAPGLKSLDDAQRIRREVLLAFERAETATDAAERQRLMTIVVVGGGPTGVELAGAFAELARQVLAEDFRQIDPRQARVVLVEGSARLLGQFPENLGEEARARLEEMGVEVRCGVRVENIAAGVVQLTGETVAAGNIVWAAGVAASPLTAQLGCELDRAGRVKVLPDLSVPGHPEVFALGDLAAAVDRDGQVVPGVSPAAMQEAKHVARQLEDELAGLPDPRQPFDYWDKGSMATIGRSAAVAKMGALELTGFPAWLAWLGVHLVFLVGFRNRVAVLLQWAYSYFTYKRGARIITGVRREE
jgi:NADH:ubiquinone reductase (H+-translocating)